MKKKNVGKLLALLLTCVMIVSVAACGGGDSPSTSNGGGESPSTSSGGGGESSPSGSTLVDSGRDTIRIAVSNDMGTLDPAQNSGTDFIGPMTMMVHQPLWYYDSNNEIEYILGTGYDWVDDVTMHIYIREGVTFANGETLDAHDVLFSLIRYNYREGQGAMFRQLNEEDSRVIDSLTLELKFNEADFNLHRNMGQYAIVRNGTTMEEAASAPNGTGPYVVDDYVTNSHLHLTRRDDYWGDLPPTKNLHFILLREEAQRTNALQTGSVDVSAVPYQDVEFVQSLPTMNINNYNNVVQQVIFFNISPTSVFHQNTEARKAVAYAVDTDAIRRLVYQDLATKPLSVVTTNCTDIDDRFFNLGGVFDAGQNLELASQYAESSGLIDQEIRLINNGSPAAVLTCELIQSNLREIGVTVNVLSYDMGSWTTYLFDETAYDMAFDRNVALSGTVMSSLRYSIDSMSAATFRNYPWDGRDEALEKIFAAATADEQTRVEWSLEVARSVNDEQLWVSLVDDVYIYAFHSDLTGNPRNNIGRYLNWENLHWTS